MALRNSICALSLALIGASNAVAQDSRANLTPPNSVAVIDVSIAERPKAGELVRGGTAVRFALAVGQQATCRTDGPVMQESRDGRCVVKYQSAAIIGPVEVKRVSLTHFQVGWAGAQRVFVMWTKESPAGVTLLAKPVYAEMGNYQVVLAGSPL